MSSRGVGNEGLSDGHGSGNSNRTKLNPRFTNDLPNGGLGAPSLPKGIDTNDEHIKFDVTTSTFFASAKRDNWYKGLSKRKRQLKGKSKPSDRSLAAANSADEGETKAAPRRKRRPSDRNPAAANAVPTTSVANFDTGSIAAEANHDDSLAAEAVTSNTNAPSLEPVVMPHPTRPNQEVTNVARGDEVSSGSAVTLVKTAPEVPTSTNGAQLSTAAMGSNLSPASITTSVPNSSTRSKHASSDGNKTKRRRLNPLVASTMETNGQYNDLALHDSMSSKPTAPLANTAPEVPTNDAQLAAQTPLGTIPQVVPAAAVEVAPASPRNEPPPSASVGSITSASQITAAATVASSSTSSLVSETGRYPLPHTMLPAGGQGYNVTIIASASAGHIEQANSSLLPPIDLPKAASRAQQDLLELNARNISTSVYQPASHIPLPGAIQGPSQHTKQLGQSFPPLPSIEDWYSSRSWFQDINRTDST